MAGEFEGSGAWVLGEGGLGVRWQCGSTEGCLVLGVHAELAFDDFDRLGEEKGFVHEEIVNKWSELRRLTVEEDSDVDGVDLDVSRLGWVLEGSSKVLGAGA